MKCTEIVADVVGDDLALEKVVGDHDGQEGQEVEDSHHKQHLAGAQVRQQSHSWNGKQNLSTKKSS